MKLSFEQLAAAVRQALRLKLGDSYSVTPPWCLIATFTDEAIVERSPTTYERYPIEIDSFGKVTLGDPQAVQVAYQVLKEARGAFIFGPALDLTEASKGKEWSCVVIQEGMSANRRFYTAPALQAAVKLFENVQCYFTHAASNRSEPDPRDIAGFIRSPKYAFIESAQKGAIVARFRSTSARATELISEMFEAGHPNLVGLSINARGKGRIVSMAEGAAYQVDSIDEVESADLVSKPAAGGRFISLVAGKPAVPVSEGDIVMFEQKLRFLRESYSALFAKLPQNPTEADVDRLLLEAAAPKPVADPPATPPAPPAAPVAAPVVVPAVTAPGTVTLTEADAKRLLTLAHTMQVDQAMAGRTMAEPLKVTLRESLIGRVGMPEAEIRAEVERFVELSAKLQQPVPGAGSASLVEVAKDEAEKFAEGVEGFFFEGATEAVRAEYKKAFGKDAPTKGFRSLKGIYLEATGDADVTGYLNESKHGSRYRALMEAVSARFVEAIGTGTLSNAFAASMNRRLIAEFRATDFSTRWRRVVSTIQPLDNFKNQERVRMGHLGDLPIVSQSGTYTEFADPTDEKVSYAASKRGAILSITREAIKGDDVGVVRRIPQLLALSAARTLHTFVFNLIVSNPTLDDAVALFAASTSRGTTSAGNLQTAALDETTIGIARQRLLKVQDKDGKTNLGLSPKILIVPPELEKSAIRHTSIPMIAVSGQNATEPNYVAQKYGLNEYIVLEHLTDANNYFILADPRLVETIEIGFVDGKEDPLILVQDQETVGSVFTADKWSYKVRHEYGGDVVEWRGMQGGIVA